MVVNIDENLRVLVPKTQPILIVEDSMPDYQAIMRVFRKLHLDNPVYHCQTGQEALDYLYQRGKFPPEKAPRPGIVLLDLNLPETDGRDILKIVKCDESLKSIPVVVFTTSESEKDVRDCYRNGANSFITKPVDLDKFMEVMSMLRSYWFETVALPQ
jgi:two-component system, response regulator